MVCDLWRTPCCLMVCDLRRTPCCLMVCDLWRTACCLMVCDLWRTPCCLKVFDLWRTPCCLMVCDLWRTPCCFMVCDLWRTPCCLVVSVVGVAERAAWLFHKQAPASGAQEEDQLAHLGHRDEAEAHEQPHLAPNGTCPTQHHRQSRQSKARAFV